MITMPLTFLLKLVGQPLLQKTHMTSLANANNMCSKNTRHFSFPICFGRNIAKIVL